jgi:hypothetical protein
MEVGWRVDGGFWWMEGGWKVDGGWMEGEWRVDGGWMEVWMEVLMDPPPFHLHPPSIGWKILHRMEVKWRGKLTNSTFLKNTHEIAENFHHFFDVHQMANPMI